MNATIRLARIVDELWGRSNAFCKLSVEQRAIIEDAVSRLEIVLREDDGIRAAEGARKIA